MCIRDRDGEALGWQLPAGARSPPRLRTNTLEGGRFPRGGAGSGPCQEWGAEGAGVPRRGCCR
eukprot:1255474-Heterocapsa_arctica.AAC.1